LTGASPLSGSLAIQIGALVILAAVSLNSREVVAGLPVSGSLNVS
jgi:hypothetical protein